MTALSFVAWRHAQQGGNVNKSDVQCQRDSPILPVKNVKETALFYAEKLGFKIDVTWVNPIYACASSLIAYAWW